VRQRENLHVAKCLLQRENNLSFQNQNQVCCCCYHVSRHAPFLVRLTYSVRCSEHMRKPNRRTVKLQLLQCIHICRHRVFSLYLAIALSFHQESIVHNWHPFHFNRTAKFIHQYFIYQSPINPLNAELNPIRHLLALVGAHHFVHVSMVRVKYYD
jgi:hypothetical protein